jgi:hypothetical protein
MNSDEISGNTRHFRTKLDALLRGDATMFNLLNTGDWKK